jgi:exonuclease VII small subunit
MAPADTPRTYEEALKDLYERLNSIDTAIRSLEELKRARKSSSWAELRRIIDRAA